MSCYLGWSQPIDCDGIIYKYEGTFYWAPAFEAFTDITAFGANIVSRLALVVLIIIGRYTSSTFIMELCKRLLLADPGGYTVNMEPHSKVTGRDKR